MFYNGPSANNSIKGKYIYYHTNARGVLGRRKQILNQAIPSIDLCYIGVGDRVIAAERHPWQYIPVEGSVVEIHRSGKKVLVGVKQLDGTSKNKWFGRESLDALTFTLTPGEGRIAVFKGERR